MGSISGQAAAITDIPRPFASRRSAPKPGRPTATGLGVFGWVYYAIARSPVTAWRVIHCRSLFDWGSRVVSASISLR
jgi:hypothetical protein